MHFCGKRLAALLLAAGILIPALAFLSGCRAGEEPFIISAQGRETEATETATTETATATEALAEPLKIEVDGTKKRVALDEIRLDSESVRVLRRGEILKIDAITPSLDTYSMTSVLYDLEKEEILCTASLPEAQWASGLTDGGFWFADALSKCLYLFDRDGNTLAEKTFPAWSWSPAAAVSAEGDAFAVYSASEMTVRVAGLDGGGEKTLKTDFPIREFTGFENGVLSAVGIENENFTIRAEDGKNEVISNDPLCSRPAPGFSLGMTEHHYIYSSRGKTMFFSFGSIDEWVTGVGENAVASTVLTEAGTGVRVYDLSDQKVYFVLLEETDVQNILLDGRELVVLSGSAQEKEYRLRLVPIPRAALTDLDLRDRDAPAEEAKPSIAIAPSVPSGSAKIVSVPVIPQYPEFPTGCESVSAVMVMRWAGADIGVAEFVEKYLPKSSAFYVQDGVKYGPSPYEHFIGTPTSSGSYGCMAPVIVKALRAYYGDSALITETTGMTLADLCSAYIDRGTPVLVWATINMIPMIRTNSWTVPDGTRFTWPGNEHCLVLVGYDEDRYYFNDPYAGALVSYSRSVSEERFTTLGSQSVVLQKP